jgi:uncharacterized protein
MIDQSPPPGEIMLDEVEPPKRPWGRRVTKGDTLRLIDLEGQQAVDTAAGTTRFMAFCSEANNFLRYGVRGTHSCFANLVEALAQFGLDRSYVVSNVNFFMTVPVAADGAAVNVDGHSKAGNYVDFAPSATCWHSFQTACKYAIPATPTT